MTKSYEIKTLLDFTKVPDEELMKMVDRNPKSIIARAYRLGRKKMNKQVVIDTMKLAYQYLGKAISDGELANCAIPVETAFKRVGLVLAELESGNSESGITKPPSTGAELITQERERQMSVEGWDAQHDAAHLKAELTQAAICYAADIAAKYETPKWRDELRSLAIHFWPWDKQWWKPTPDNPIRQLTKAGALIAAEIDRLTRLGGYRKDRAKIVCKYEDWDDTTNPRLCRCAKYEGVDCGNVPDDVSGCPDFEIGHIPEVCHDDPYEVHKQIRG